MPDVPALQNAQPRTPAGRRIYAVGDVHGRLDLLDRLLARIADDAGRSTASAIGIVFLGDYVDRGPQSRGVVERLMAGPPATGPLAGADWVCLRGNHEEYLLRFLEDPYLGTPWCRNGGLETIRSYVGELPEGRENDMGALQLLLSRAMPPAHLRFLSRLPLMHREGDYLFVHAGIRPGVALEEQDPWDLMWIRDDFLFDPTPLGVMVVHGHTPGPVPEVRTNRIGIDTGAYYSGTLTAVVLDGADMKFLAS